MPAAGIAGTWKVARSMIVKASKTVKLGYREASPPFSFLDEAKRPIGYSLELCEAVVEEIGAEVDSPGLKIQLFV